MTSSMARVDVGVLAVGCIRDGSHFFQCFHDQPMKIPPTNGNMPNLGPRILFALLRQY